jgi:long-chain acyl-CoA synthetase
VAETVPARFHQAAERFGERPLLFRKTSTGWQSMSYQQLERSARGLALALMERLGVAKGDLVALYCDNRTEWLVASLAIHFAAAVDIPRGAEAPAEILVNILRHSQARFAIVENASVLEKLGSMAESLQAVVLMDAPDSYPDRTIRFSELVQYGLQRLETAGHLVDQRWQMLADDDLASIIYTSGTAGDPKGAMIRHRNFLHNPSPLAQRIALVPDDRYLSLLPAWHSYERMIEYTGMFLGGQLYYGNLRSLREDLAGVRPTVFSTVPDFWISAYKIFQHRLFAGVSLLRRALLRSLLWSALQFGHARRILAGRIPRIRPASSLRRTLKVVLARCMISFYWFPFWLADRMIFRRLRQTLGGCLRVATSGAGPLPPFIDEFFDTAGIPILEAYGITEAMVAVSIRDLKAPILQTVGRPLPGIAVEIRDKSGSTLPPGPPGQIFVRGAGVFAGYWKNDTLSRTVIDEFGWLATGDQGRWTQDGELQILGREDDTIVLANGEKVLAPRLENELVTDPWIQQAVVVGQGQPTMAVLLVLDPMVTKEWAGAHGWSLSAETLLEHPAITAEIRTHLERLFSDRSRFASFERITLFRLLSRPLIVGRELSGTGKLRRAEFNRLYAKQIEEIYRQG